MSKMNDMAMTIEELRNAATAINDAANWLAQQFSSDDKQQAEDISARPEKKTKPALTLEEVRAVRLINLVPDIQLKFENFLKSTVQARPVDPKHYEALLREAEVL